MAVAVAVVVVVANDKPAFGREPDCGDIDIGNSIEAVVRCKLNLTPGVLFFHSFAACRHVTDSRKPVTYM